MSTDSAALRGVHTPTPGAVDPIQASAMGDRRFQLLRQVHASHSHLVFKGYDRQSGEPVAYKVARAPGARPAGPPHGPAAEGELLATHAGRYLPRALAWGEREDGREYLATAWCAGTTLERLMDTDTPITPPRILGLALALTHALETLHRRGRVHGDLSPDNVLVGPLGGAVLLDLGLSSEVGTRSGDRPRWGTPAYVAPESWEDPPHDVRADLYSLGCVLHELTAGVHPFARAATWGAGPLAWAHAHRVGTPDLPPAHLAPGLRRLLSDLVSRATCDRPASAAAVRARLRRLIAESPHRSL